MNLDVGSFLKNERLKKDYTLRGLAREVNMTPSYISKVENGEIKSPSPEAMVQLFDALKLDHQFLIFYGFAEGEADAEFLKKQVESKSDKQVLFDNITYEMKNNMDRETLEALHVMVFKYRDLMLNVKKVDSSGERLPMTLLKELMDFFKEKYAKKEIKK